MLIIALLISFISTANSQSTMQPATAPPSYGYMMHPFPYAYGYNGGLPGALPGGPIGVPFTGGMPPPGIMPGMPPGGLWGMPAGMPGTEAELLGMAAGMRAGMAAGVPPKGILQAVTAPGGTSVPAVPGISPKEMSLAETLKRGLMLAEMLPAGMLAGMPKGGSMPPGPSETPSKEMSRSPKERVPGEISIKISPRELPAGGVPSRKKTRNNGQGKIRQD
ncbi:unnamed protein product [Cylicocyclus nassatus]|uniref:Uncharacterized protein n=1 Tax=Cylicocyclus nassatus TaxID=53992 RepID=A0AA36H7E9_CYLNA|nr:unnamed protein product [Cylicocyclus nassatus]